MRKGGGLEDELQFVFNEKYVILRFRTGLKIKT